MAPVSRVWEYFDRGNRLATCRRCGRTLSSISKSGTSHLWRHLDTDICTIQAAQRLHASSTTWLPPPPAGSADDDDKFVQDIANLYDELVAKDLVFIEGGDETPEVAGAGDGHALNYVRLPQAVSRPMRLFQEKKGGKYPQGKSPHSKRRSRKGATQTDDEES